VKRINYLIAPSERIFGHALPLIVSPPLRRPLVALAGALASLSLPYGVEAARLRDLDRTRRVYEMRLAATALDVRQVRSLERDVARLRALTDQVASIRQSGAARANEIAALGNELPGDAWLTALRKDGDNLDVEGGSGRLRTVAAAIAALARLPRYSTARLVAVHGEVARPGVTYSIVLERRR
jgi:Tfp pilus assembly protein PilN